MKRVVWKFPLSSETTIDLPADAQPRLVGLDPFTGVVSLWIELDAEAPKVSRLFTIVGTGHQIDNDSIYVGSVIDRPFVWHVYEELSE